MQLSKKSLGVLKLSFKQKSLRDLDSCNKLRLHFMQQKNNMVTEERTNEQSDIVTL